MKKNIMQIETEHENRNDKLRSPDKIIITVLATVLLGLIITIVVLSYSCVSHDECVDYMSRFDRTEDIAVTDFRQRFCYNNETFDVEDRFKELERSGYLSITHIDKEWIYLEQQSDNGKYVLYKSDYELSNVTKIFEFYADRGHYDFLESDLLYYENYDVCYTHRFSTNTTEVVDENYKDDYLKSVNRYTVWRKINAFSSETTKFYITDNRTGEQKIVPKSVFKTIEPSKYFIKERAFCLFKIYAVQEDVFMTARANGVHLIFKYDFEKDEVKYYSWINESDLIGEPREIFFFT